MLDGRRHIQIFIHIFLASKIRGISVQTDSPSLDPELCTLLKISRTHK